jgi:multimeric flavodoxin WrbA
MRSVIMKVYAINGSPRKNQNTATLLQKALDGVKESVKDKEVETKIINLYDLNFTGCISCFACKRLDGKSYGKCAVKDDLYEILNEVSQADGIILGSPIYFLNITGQLKSFLERLLFPYLAYAPNHPSIAPKRMPTAFIYTMGATEEMMNDINLAATFNIQGISILTTLNIMETWIERTLTKPEVLHSYDTYQFDDYSKYKADIFSEEEKAEHRRVQFPLDCQRAFELGANLIK